MTRYNFQAGCLYNADETGLTTCPQAPQNHCHKGIEQVGQVTSAERGTFLNQGDYVLDRYVGKKTNTLLGNSWNTKKKLTHT